MPNDRQYEFVYVLAPTVANAAVENLQRETDEHVRKLGGAVENTDLWGRRKLAYPIGDFTEGIYVVQLLRGPGAMVAELERRMRVHDDVLRYLTVRVDDDLRKARRAAEKRKAEVERRRAAREPQGEPSPPAEPAGEARAEAEPPPAAEAEAPSAGSAEAPAAPAEAPAEPADVTPAAAAEVAASASAEEPSPAAESDESAAEEPPAAESDESAAEEPPAAESDESAG